LDIVIQNTFLFYILNYTIQNKNFIFWID